MQCNATQRNATQRNATQRNATRPAHRRWSQPLLGIPSLVRQWLALGMKKTNGWIEWLENGGIIHRSSFIVSPRFSNRTYVRSPDLAMSTYSPQCSYQLYLRSLLVRTYRLRTYSYEQTHPSVSLVVKKLKTSVCPRSQLRSDLCIDRYTYTVDQTTQTTTVYKQPKILFIFFFWLVQLCEVQQTILDIHKRQNHHVLVRVFFCGRGHPRNNNF